MATILIVDDEAKNLKGYRDTFEDELPDCKILTASDEYEAENLIKNNPDIDVIITDLMMKSDKGGIKVLQAAKSIDPSIMVIIITAYDTKLDRREAFKLGAFDCLEKGSVGVKTANELVHKTKNAIYTRYIVKDLINHQKAIDSFAKYFDPVIFQKIKKDPNLLSPTNRTVTIVFWDIRGFSSLSEKLKTDTNLIANFLKEYLEESSKTVINNNGIVDKFIGDGVMALFGVFDESKNSDDKSAVDACKAALELRNKFNMIYSKWLRQWERVTAEKIDIGLGCGIHTGEALVGNLGTESREHFTAIGPHVNLAARIESTAQIGEIRFSATTKSRVDGFFKYKKKETLKNIKNINGSFDIFEIIE